MGHLSAQGRSWDWNCFLPRSRTGEPRALTNPMKAIGPLSGNLHGYVQIFWAFVGFPETFWWVSEENLCLRRHNPEPSKYDQNVGLEEHEEGLGGEAAPVEHGTGLVESGGIVVGVKTGPILLLRHSRLRALLLA